MREHGTDENRFEREGDEFYERIHAAYEVIAEREKERVEAIADEASIEAITAERIAAVLVAETDAGEGVERGEDEWRMPPGLKRSLPFYARKPWVKLGSPIPLFEHLHRTFGKIAHYRFMGTTIVFVNDPEYIQEILVNQAASFIKERTLKRMKILLGEGLITSDDPIHMRQRRIAAPAFHRQRIAAYAGQIVASAVGASERMRAGVPFDVAAA